MEDAHTQLLELPGDPSAAFFAVFDGHGKLERRKDKDKNKDRCLGGARIAKYASQHLHTQVAASSDYGSPADEYYLLPF